MGLSRRQRLGRFAGVGVVNTAIDFVLFGVLRTAGVPMVPANTVSTGAGLAFSFAANRRFTFGDRRGDARRQAALFAGGTLAGLWLLQPLVIAAVAAFAARQGWHGQPATIWLPKAVAIGAGLCGNYLFYDRVVFGATGPRGAARTRPGERES